MNQKGIPLEASFSPDSQFVFSGMFFFHMKLYCAKTCCYQVMFCYLLFMYIHFSFFYLHHCLISKKPSSFMTRVPTPPGKSWVIS